MYALDQLIVTVAVPQIVDQFKAQEKIAWLNTGFFIPAATGILLYSQIMTIWNPRWVYLSALIIFEVGSAVCVNLLDNARSSTSANVYRAPPSR